MIFRTLRMVCALFLITTTAPAFAQNQIVELFISVACLANDTADDVLASVRQDKALGDVLTLTCDLSNESCDARHSEYTRKKVLRRYSTPSSVVNGRYDVTAYDEAIMRSALAMVRSTASVRSIDVTSDETALMVDFPDMRDDELYTPWVAVYDPSTTQVHAFKRLPEIRGDAPVCMRVEDLVVAGQAYAVFLHKSDGEIVAFKY